MEISGFELSFFLVHKQDAFCTLFAHSIPPKSLFGSAAGSAVGSDDVGNTDRSSVCESARARQRGHPDSGAEERRERPRAPTSDPDERGQGPFDRYVSPCEASCLFLFGGGGRVGECPEGVWSRGSDLSALASWRPPPPRGRRRPRRPRGKNKKSMCLLAGDLNFQTSVVNLQLQKVQKRKRFFWTVLGRTLGSVFWTKIREWYLRPGVATTTQGPGRCPRGVLMNTRTPRWLH